MTASKDSAWPERANFFYVGLFDADALLEIVQLNIALRKRDKFRLYFKTGQRADFR